MLKLGLIALAVFLTATTISNWVFAEERRVTPNSKATDVRIEYRGFETPNSLIYEELLKDVSEMQEESPRTLDDNIYGALNIIFADEAQAWIFPEKSERRYSKSETQKVAQLMLRQGVDLKQKKEASKREILCPTDRAPPYGDAGFDAFRDYDDAKMMHSEATYNEAVNELGPELMAGLRSWIGRSKQGYHKTVYNYRKRWKDHDRFYLMHLNMCASLNS